MIAITEACHSLWLQPNGKEAMWERKRLRENLNAVNVGFETGALNGNAR